MNCGICKNFIGKQNILILHELLKGTGDTFPYRKCDKCGVIQIESVPEELSKYYENYYTADKNFITISPFRKKLWHLRRKIWLSPLYPIVNEIKRNTILEWAYYAKINKNSKILDVGCGNGDILYELSKHGFTQLCGIDPNLNSTLNHKDISLDKSDIISYKASGKFDFIMFNHSLEHIAEQHETICSAISLLKKNGVIMVRIPIVNKAFEIYKENWIQLDPPRHLFIHTVKSFNLLCSLNNAFIYHTFFDSKSLQFIGSEQCKKGIPLYSDKSYKNGLVDSIFTQKEINVFTQKAIEYNKQKLGDQAVFFLRSCS